MRGISKAMLVSAALALGGCETDKPHARTAEPDRLEEPEDADYLDANTTVRQSVHSVITAAGENRGLTAVPEHPGLTLFQSSAPVLLLHKAKDNGISIAAGGSVEELTSGH